MTAPAADPVCLCGDRQAEHRLGKRGCKVPDCGCDRFEAAELATGGIITKPVALPLGACVIDPPEAVVPPPVDPDAAVRKELRIQGFSSGTPEFAGAMAAARASEQSTSARLRQVERELADVVANAPCVWCAGIGVAPEEVFGRDSDGAPNVDGPQPCPEGCEVARWLQAERNDAADTERELAGARGRIAEMDQLLADAALKLVNQQTESAAEVERLRTLVGQADERFTQLRAELPAPPVELYGYDAFQCLTCGSRYRLRHTDHPHPLAPVRISIYER
jgi:hypothetical protein